MLGDTLKAFLFQTGAIKSLFVNASFDHPTSFLFQTGAIKSRRQHFRKRIQTRFYSKLVRLKGNNVAEVVRAATKFLFQTGAIKSS